MSGKATYNYYTPYNWHCGCVATALAQLMRFHGHPTASVTTNVFTSAKGIYFLFAPANRSCTVTLAATYRGVSTTNITTHTSASTSPSSVDYTTGNCQIPRTGLAIGNSWGNDFVIEVKPFHGILLR